MRRRARRREKFKELAEKYTAGKVKVEVYPNSSLYKDKEELEALQLGAVQLLAPSTAKFGPLGFTEFDALDLPFMFRDEATFKKFAAATSPSRCSPSSRPRASRDWPTGTTVST